MTENDPTRELLAGASERSRTSAHGVRTDDLEPYLTLQYIARMLKVLAGVVVVALVVEMAVGLATDGVDALVPVFARGVQSLMLAAGLWGAADLTRIIIDGGHDIRGARILLGRMAARSEGRRPAQADGDGGP